MRQAVWKNRARIVSRAGRGCLAVLAVAVLVSCSDSGHKSASSGSSSGPSAAIVGSSSSSAGSNSSTANDWNNIPAVAQKVSPSIVTIQTSEGLGSGVIFTADGVVATDAHVVGTSKSVTVVFADGGQSTGTVIATDEVTDLAAVRTTRSGLPAATFEQPLPALGDLAIAIGSPLGFTNSVTSGVVSGVGRSIPGSASQTQSLVDLIQTDAAISPGNSGGALVNGSGQVVGLTEAYIPPTQGAVSIGFAIPAHTVTDVMNQLLTNGTATHPYLGVSTTAVTQDLQQQLGVGVDHGALVQVVASGGPAEMAGVQVGDIIVGADGKPVDSPEDLIGIIRAHKPGDAIPLQLARGSGTTNVTATLSDRPS